MKKLFNGMVIDAQMIADSISPLGNRITTFVCEYPRFIHAQLMTHRMLSRNAQSSRAVPVRKMIERAKSREHLVFPLLLKKNKRGMVPGIALGDSESMEIQGLLSRLRDFTFYTVARLDELGVHKQWANRFLEPFSTITAIYTGTEETWNHFFKLRNHPEAQDEIRDLARMMEAQMRSPPTERSIHLPYGDDFSDIGVKRAIARCARVSYLSYDGSSSEEKDLALFERLVGSEPPHSSPLEHVAYACNSNEYYANYKGWASYRFCEGF